MMRLLRAELARIRSRQMTWIIAAAATAMLALITYGIVTTSSPPSAAEQQQAERAYQQAKNDFDRFGAQQRQECLTAQAREREQIPDADLGCDHLGPQREHFGKPTPDFARLWPSAQAPATVFLGVLALALGGSWVGAEFTTGSMATWLTYEPRRTRVFLSKMVAAAIALTLGAAVLTGLFLAAIRASFAGYGVPVDLDRNGWVDVWLAFGRMVAFPVLTGLGGGALAFIVRHSAAVLGISLGAVVVDQWAGAQLQDKARWTLFNNMLGFIEGKWRFSYMRCAQDMAARYDCTPSTETVWFAQAAAVLGAVVALALGVAWWQFRRRDVS